MRDFLIRNKYRILAVVLIFTVNPALLPFALDYLVFIEVIGLAGFSSSVLYYYRYFLLGYYDKVLLYFKSLK